jgi:hypothetical protein
MKDDLGSLVFILLTLGFFATAFAFGLTLEFYIGIIVTVVVLLIGVVLLWFLPSRPFDVVEASGLTLSKKAQTAIINGLIVAGIAALSAASGTGYPPTLETVYVALLAFAMAFLTYMAKIRGIEE